VNVVVVDRQSPVKVVNEFIDCINRADVKRMGELMTDQHRLYVFDEPPLTGRDENVDAWTDYVTGFPTYRIHPHRVVGYGARVAVLGHTTGSHLNLPDEEEEKLTLIWVAELAGGQLLSWRLVEDTPDWRRELGLEKA
jgi:hypothetical protein